MCVSVRVCLYVCVRARARARVCVCVCVCVNLVHVNVRYNINGSIQHSSSLFCRDLSSCMYSFCVT